MNDKRFWLPATILIAFGLRLHNLTYHSLWFDEAISVYWARQTVPRILEVGFTLVEDRLPPLYYLILKGWTGLFGFSETGVRSLSVFLGVLLVPVIASLATVLFNRRVALVVALLVALNPFLVWYSQEARMYAPAVLFGTLAVGAFLKFVRLRHRQVKPSAGDWQSQAFIVLFILFAALGLYSHLYTGFLLPALGLWLIIGYPRARRLWLIFALGVLIILLAYTPIALAIWRFSGESTPGDPFSHVGQRAWWLLQSFTVWKASLSPILQFTIPSIVVIYALLAYLRTANYQSRLARPLFLITLLLVVPFAIASLLLWRNYLAFFGERYFIVMTPWLLLLAAVGAENLSQWVDTRMSKWQMANFKLHHATRLVSGLPYALLLLVTVLPLPGQWSTPAAKEAWRQSVAYLAKHAESNHGILIHPDWVRYPFQFYFRGPGQTYAAFSQVTPATDLDGPLQGVVGDHPVIWLIQSHLDGPDPDRLVEQWLATRYPLVTELYPPGITLKGYAPGYQLHTLPPEATPVDLRFENGMQLIGYQAESPVAAADDLFHPPSGWVHVILYWTASQPIRQTATPYVHLIGPEGVWGASLERPNDALNFYPPPRWYSAETDPGLIRQDMDVNLNPATPPGTYQLVVGLRGYETLFPLAQVKIR
ncbi:MAG: glycosyltransferase family 39 protein [Anaerolineae bacterium]|nr:glycosyltransferase family 39 protein [Anaerolineae bacterium]